MAALSGKSLTRSFGKQSDAVSNRAVRCNIATCAKWILCCPELLNAGFLELEIAHALPAAGVAPPCSLHLAQVYVQQVLSLARGIERFVSTRTTCGGIARSWQIFCTYFLHLHR
ncbi:uncharacterized protein HMPREF1120_02036 [Exophiala dermatitidis NIH/UT8656]|uniref:Uncharacterized protein n=1 Tax=Exophiala dermatitidis (strain ATCC 34100 / CBS 525.76 / NIH/UT8656) TaxID=858893 RepID=H6BQU2_EXODN|nr:uncharacterized protein HMPREF1120_02036 [Exophiala dermatitidis NIH/UT8656]EHY53855.1 hypothetical protein HMPREF1120_02036 [Exophiala dermatitidis NIH/UT8656]